MHVKLLVATGAAMVASAMPGHAQNADAGALFSGPYAGVEAGVSEHRFDIETTDPRFGSTETRTYRAAGLGGGAFAGYDLAVASRLRLGIEAAVTTGGGAPVAQIARSSYGEDPQWGYRIGGRAGYVVADRALVYATLGYGAQRVDLRNAAGVVGADNWNRSISYGGGVELRLSRRVGLRLDYRELRNVTRALNIGIPIRF